MSMPSASRSSSRSRPSFFSSADSPRPAYPGTSARTFALSTPSGRAATYAASDTIRSYGLIVRPTRAPCRCPRGDRTGRCPTPRDTGRMTTAPTSSTRPQTSRACSASRSPRRWPGRPSCTGTSTARASRTCPTCRTCSASRPSCSRPRAPRPRRSPRSCTTRSRTRASPRHEIVDRFGDRVAAHRARLHRRRHRRRSTRARAGRAARRGELAGTQGAVPRAPAHRARRRRAAGEPRRQAAQRPRARSPTSAPTRRRGTASTPTRRRSSGTTGRSSTRSPPLPEADAFLQRRARRRGRPSSSPSPTSTSPAPRGAGRTRPDAGRITPTSLSDPVGTLGLVPTSPEEPDHEDQPPFRPPAARRRVRARRALHARAPRAAGAHRGPAAAPPRARHRPQRIDGRPEARRREAERALPRRAIARRGPHRARRLRRRGAAARAARAARPAGGARRDRRDGARRLHEPLGRLAEGPRGARPYRPTPPPAGCCCSPTGSPTRASSSTTSSSRSPSGTKARAATTTIGFGEGFDEDLLAALADRSGGNAYFAETPEDAPGIFGEEFDGLASLVAQNVSVEIRPGDAVEVLGVLNDYPLTTVPDGMQVQVGDAYGDEVRRIVFQLHIPNMALLGPAKVADVIVRYVAVGEQIAQHEVKVPVTVNLVSADEAAAGEHRRRGHRAGVAAAGGEGATRRDGGRGPRRLGGQSLDARRRVGRVAVAVRSVRRTPTRSSPRRSCSTRPRTRRPRPTRCGASGRTSRPAAPGAAASRNVRSTDRAGGTGMDRIVNPASVRRWAGVVIGIVAAAGLTVGTSAPAGAAPRGRTSIASRPRPSRWHRAGPSPSPRGRATASSRTTR